MPNFTDLLYIDRYIRVAWEVWGLDDINVPVYVQLLFLTLGAVGNIIFGVACWMLRTHLKRLDDLTLESQRAGKWRIYVEGRLTDAGIIPVQPPPA